VIQPHYLKLSGGQVLGHEVEQEGGDVGISRFPLYVELVVIGATDSGAIRNVVPMLKPKMGSPI
jgi:hypothetical protein